MTSGRMIRTAIRAMLKGPLARWFALAFRVLGRVGKDRLSLIAAGVAFFCLLALFPALTAVLAIGGLVLERQEILEQLDQLNGLVPEDVLSIIRDQAGSVAASSGLELTVVVSVAFALWSASRGINVLCDGLNVAYGVQESRGIVLRNLIVLGMTIAMVIGLVLVAIAMVGIPVLLAYVPLGPVADAAARGGSWILLSLTALTGLAVLYRFGPSRRQVRLVWLTPGALFAFFSWVATSVAFTIYVSHFTSYNESFGALAGVIVLMLWLWLTVLVVLIGAELNAEIEGRALRAASADPEQSDANPSGDGENSKGD
ncbi:YihY/virulence factor BrkB family protein [Halovulum sp. GXIMD14793]